MKYLAVKNWGRFQTAKKNCSWIKDYVEKDFDPEISKLTVFQRGILDMCCRLRGRLAKNLSNDPQWIVGAVSILPQERRNAISAISQLVAKGFLIPTNQAVDSLEERREEEKREEREEMAKELPPIALAQKVVIETSLPKNPNIMNAVAGAIEFLVQVDGKSPEAAVEFLKAHVLDETEKGRPPNRFWFDDRKWIIQKENLGASKTKLERNIEALRAAAAQAGN